MAGIRIFALAWLGLACGSAAAASLQTHFTVGVTIVAGNCTGRNSGCPANSSTSAARTFKTPYAPSTTTLRPATNGYPAMMTTNY